jgi:hypothetical protein
MEINMSVSNPGKAFFSCLHDKSYLGNLKSIDRALNHCAVEMDFWGNRTLRDRDNFMTPIGLDEVAYKVIHSAVCKDELKAREELVKKIKDFYTTSNVCAAQVHLFTLLFGWVSRLNSAQVSDGPVKMIDRKTAEAQRARANQGQHQSPVVSKLINILSW